MTKPVDFTKPCQTRDGRPVRILCTDLKSSTPVVAAIATPLSGERVVTKKKDGRSYDDHGCSCDIINVPVRREGWINVYGSDVCSSKCASNLSLTREMADLLASPKRIACIKVSFNEGEGL